MDAELNPVERMILEQTYRFGMGLPQLGRLVSGPLVADCDIHDALDGLAAREYLGQATLYGTHRYYFLGERAAKEFELDKADIGPLKEREKTLRLAMVRVCLAATPPHRPLTRSDFEHHYPALFRARPRGSEQRSQEPRFRDYYLAGARLGLVRVDFGGRGRYDRILKKAYRQIVTHNAMPPYARLIADEAFELTIVTAFPTKAVRLRADAADGRIGVPINVHLVEELRELVAPLPRPAGLTQGHS
jgi:hypothetical protein